MLSDELIILKMSVCHFLCMDNLHTDNWELLHFFRSRLSILDYKGLGCRDVLMPLTKDLVPRPALKWSRFSNSNVKNLMLKVFEKNLLRCYCSWQYIFGSLRFWPYWTSYQRFRHFFFFFANWILPESFCRSLSWINVKINMSLIRKLKDWVHSVQGTCFLLYPSTGKNSTSWYS